MIHDLFAFPARALRMRDSRRKRGRYPDEQEVQNRTDDEEEPEELDTQTAKHAEAMSQQLAADQVTLAIPDEEPPPPYHPGPPPAYPEEESTGIPIEHVEDNAVDTDTNLDFPVNQDISS